MKYIMPCVLKSPVVEYHRSLVDDIANRFGLTFTQRQAIPAHFTLKYHFATADIGPVEVLLDEFVRNHRRTPVTVGGFGHFDEDVVFVEVTLSQATQRSLEALIAALRTLPAEVWEYLKPFERRFTAWLDNVTILRKTGERDGMDLWTVHRSFDLQA